MVARLVPIITWFILFLQLCSAVLPFGIVGIVKSAQVSSKYQGGDYEGAVQASRDAKKWSMIALICGLVGYLLYLIVVIAGVVL